MNPEGAFWLGVGLVVFLELAVFAMWLFVREAPDAWEIIQAEQRKKTPLRESSLKGWVWLLCVRPWWGRRG